MNTLLRLVTLLLAMANPCLAMNREAAWQTLVDVTGADIKVFFQKGALDVMLNENKLLKECLVADGKLLPSQETADLITRIMIERVATKLKLLDDIAARQTAWLNLNLVIATMCRSDPESLGRLIRELGEERTGDFLNKVVKIAGDSGGSAGAVDAIYLGDILAKGKARELFSSYGPNPGRYTADFLLDRMIEIDRLKPGCLRSTQKIRKSGPRGIHIGIIGDMSHKTAASALGARHELDAGFTVAKREGSDLEGIGVDVYFKKSPSSADLESGGTDMDVYFRRNNMDHAVQVKDSSRADLLDNIGRWSVLSCQHMNVDLVNPLEMLKRVEFMFPQKSGIAEEAQRTADLDQVHTTRQNFLIAAA